MSVFAVRLLRFSFFPLFFKRHCDISSCRSCMFTHVVSLKRPSDSKSACLSDAADASSDRFEEEKQTPLLSFLTLSSPFVPSKALPIFREVTVTLTMSATKSQPSSTSTQGECVVCGRFCSTRCSSCAQHGLSWMYFCSTEHQRLVSPLSVSWTRPRSGRELF